MPFRVAALAVPLLAVPLLAADPGPALKPLGLGVAQAAPVERFYDITYTTPGGRAVQLDLVVPKGPGPFPVVVCLHGGAWKYGSRKDLSRSVINGLDFVGGESGSLLDLLAARGFAAASASYRLAPRDPFPAQIQDAKTAVRFLRANAAKYRLDPDRVAACGFSAGGHLACLLAATAGNREFAGADHLDQPDSVACVVNFFGPTDMTLYSESPGVESAYMRPFLGVRFRENPSAYEKASPIAYARKDVAPVLTIHGTADLIVPVIHAERFHAKLKEVGAESELLTVPGKGHGWGGETAAETTAAAVRFLASHLRGAK